MPLDKFFRPDQRVSGYRYQLGLDRRPEDETRRPTVLWGDPAICAHLEAESRFTSTNPALSWTEYLDDYTKETFARAYVEDCLLRGVPPTHYAYTAIGHDERAVPDSSGESSPAKRSAVHIKIVNERLNNGKFLQPFFAPLTRFLTTLYLADACIRYGWTHPLDPGRERITGGRRHTSDLREAKENINAAVMSAERLPDGSPDPIAILAILHELGVEEIFPKDGVLGRKGIEIRFSDHRHPARFFSTEYSAVHAFIKTKDHTHHENHRRSASLKAQQCFPGGRLLRTPEQAACIAAALKQALDARAEFNRNRYAIDRPSLAFTGPWLPRDDGLGSLHDAPAGSDRGLREPASRTANDDVQLDRRRVETIGNEVTSQTPRTHEPEFRTETTVEARNPHLRRAYTQHGDGIAAVVGGIASAARLLEIVSQRISSTGSALAAADRTLGEQDRQLARAIAAFSPGPITPVDPFPIRAVEPDALGAEQFLRRVRRPAADILGSVRPEEVEPHPDGPSLDP